MTRAAGRPAALPTPGYQAPRRLFLDDGQCLVRFFPERGGSPVDYDFGAFPIARELVVWLATAWPGRPLRPGGAGRPPLHARAVDAEAAARMLRKDNDRLRERVAVYAQVIHELRTELDRRTDNNTQRSPVRSLPTSII
ncbi:hypothetical protein ACFY8B_30550 [Streptomyces sp. NPDC012751]|uniref:hypothetical protein n=1 Tax=Streptomyces sp. NPDC012751 TaxID=3364846 RepID=UPI0036A8E8D3